VNHILFTHIDILFIIGRNCASWYVLSRKIFYFITQVIIYACDITCVVFAILIKIKILQFLYNYDYYGTFKDTDIVSKIS